MIVFNVAGEKILITSLAEVFEVSDSDPVLDHLLSTSCLFVEVINK